MKGTGARRIGVPLLRTPRSYIAALAAIIATVSAARAISLGVSVRPAQGAAGQAIAAAAVTSRSGASIAHDVAEVLRLSGIMCEAQYNGDGAVTVSGMSDDRVMNSRPCRRAHRLGPRLFRRPGWCSGCRPVR